MSSVVFLLILALMGALYAWVLVTYVGLSLLARGGEDGRPPNGAEHLRDRMFYPWHWRRCRKGEDACDCTCYRCRPNRWKGDWTHVANDPVGGDHHRDAATPAAATGTPFSAAASAALGGAGAGPRYVTVPLNRQPTSVMGRYAHLYATNPQQMPLLPERHLVGVDYVIGFRSWLLASSDAQLRLCGNNGVVWDGKPARHEPMSFGEPLLRHESPSPDCSSCGYYAWLAPVAVVGGWPPNAVSGLCQMWGRIIRHGDGYRAQYARPLAIVRAPLAPPGLQRGIAEELGLMLIGPEDQLAVAREHGHVWGDPLPPQNLSEQIAAKRRQIEQTLRLDNPPGDGAESTSSSADR